jgi:hypothetical protein
MNYKDKSLFCNNCMEWMFTRDDRAPMGFIPTFFAIIVISTFVGLFLIPVIRRLMY